MLVDCALKKVPIVLNRKQYLILFQEQIKLFKLLNVQIFSLLALNDLYCLNAICSIFIIFVILKCLNYLFTTFFH